jgi:thiol:disulfide interchange protein DsbD
MGKQFIKAFTVLFSLFLLGVTTLNAQVFNPVKWEYKSKSIGNNEFELQFVASIDGHWHMYSQNVDEGGPIPTSFIFNSSPDFELIGEMEEPKGITIEDPVFKMKLKYFEKGAIFTQKVKLNNSATKITGELEFMSCDDEKCLPTELLEFEFNLKGESTESSEAAAVEPMTITVSGDAASAQNQGVLTPVTWETEVVDLGSGEYELRAIATIEEHWHLYSMELSRDDGPVATEFNVLSPAGVQAEKVVEIGDVIEEFDPNFEMELRYYSNTVTLSKKVKVDEENISLTDEVYFMACDAHTCIPPEAVELMFTIGNGGSTAAVESADAHTEDTDKPEGRSMLSVMILSFLGGLAALLTPCVFPMIPMTVSFFTKQSKTKAEGIRNALIYGFSIIFIYVVLGIGVSAVFGADALNAMSTNVWFNILFFVLLVVFAISFLGAFEITLPSSWVNKADAKADKGGLIGIFFMAFVLVLVSFSCTGPIIGTLLVEAAVTGGYAGPILGMLSFSTALALPFALFAMFPGWMNSLPKSGGWLNTVKVVLGFLELALAFKFLSNADLVLQAGWLPREVFIAIWITVFGTLAIYLFGWIKLPHDSPLDGISVGRLLMAILVAWFTIYLIPGMWGAPLKIISGFPPPSFYSESPNGVGYKSSAVVVSSGDHAGIPKGAEPDHCPYNLNCFHDYDAGLAYAKEANLPVLLDFTGWACVNCRKMEEQVWSDPHVLEMLTNDYVLISLYVDEKTVLPEGERYVSPTTGKKIKTVGNKWSDMQIREYGTNAQPYYVVIDHKEVQLHEHAAYNPDIPKFVEWLERGKKLFDEK